MFWGLLAPLVALSEGLSGQFLDRTVGKENTKRLGLPPIASGVNTTGQPSLQKGPVLCPKGQEKNKKEIFNLINYVKY